jgi:hypothetical protein
MKRDIHLTTFAGGIASRIFKDLVQDEILPNLVDLGFPEAGARKLVLEFTFTARRQEATAEDTPDAMMVTVCGYTRLPKPQAQGAILGIGEDDSGLFASSDYAGQLSFPVGENPIGEKTEE